MAPRFGVRELGAWNSKKMERLDNAGRTLALQSASVSTSYKVFETLICHPSLTPNRTGEFRYRSRGLVLILAAVAPYRSGKISSIL